MSAQDEKKIFVYADWVSLNGPCLVGALVASPGRGEEIFSFEYNQEWLDRTGVRALDPSLELFEGRQYPPQQKSNFGIFLDSCPDRWGRMLMERREVILARTESRPPKKLYESDFLLGVFDQHRMGGLRFKTPSSDKFLSFDVAHASPPWTRLNELEEATRNIETQNEVDDATQLKWIRMLIAPGSSLGGARPKSSVVDSNGNLWIAKFPSKNDRVDVGLWEKLAHDLAGRAKVEMAEATLEKFGTYHTFITKRFDRRPTGGRFHFASAMTLLQRSDGDDYSKGASYLELVEFLISNGSKPDQDLEQLWRRIVFYICISNCDDHLRNHGFLMDREGWHLSPAFDVNPMAGASGLKLNISEKDNSQDLCLTREVAPLFRVSKDRADEIINEVKWAVKSWRAVATNLGINRSEQELMQTAFRLADS
jgi:serine/threonine-protein kinase HipA